MRQYPSKLLLFGEYTVIQSSQALAMPFSKYSGQWQYGGDAMDLMDLLVYLEGLNAKNELLCQLDLKAFRQALNKGLCFDSNIPKGYGLGSSGALTAAVYQVYRVGESQSDWQALQAQLAQIESYFHGASSGIDPLVIYLNSLLLIHEDKSICQPEWSSPKGDYTMFLLDTKVERKTAPLVEIYKTNCQDTIYRRRVEAELMPINDNAIHSFLQKNTQSLFEQMHLISHFQFKYFDAMILDDFKEIWLDGLNSDFFKLKLCGAGGGGMILGLTNDYEKTQAHLKDYSLMKVLNL